MVAAAQLRVGLKPAMLQLERIFRDGAQALREAGGLSTSPSLPAAVLLMQSDVLNSYRYALDHYLPLSLDKPFLQKSSLGTPYQKWAKFTNDDFNALSFAIANLVRYSGRLVEELLCAKLKSARLFSEMKALSNDYTVPSVKMRLGYAVGVRCEENQMLSISPLPDNRSEPVRQEYDISNEEQRRSLLAKVRASGEHELGHLMKLYVEYSALCEGFYTDHQVVGMFEGLHPSWLQ